MTPTHEPPLHIDTREQLIFVLCEAAELEHSLACAYLFAAWSMRTRDDDGLAAHQLAAVRRWERTVTAIAVQEMAHLALASNLLTALGAAPHLARPNLPQRARYYPEDIQLSLEPFTADTLRHFIYLERPEGVQERDASPFTPARHAPAPVRPPGQIVPRGEQFATVGHLYRGIAQGFATLVHDLGEEAVFLGSPRAQATQVDFRFPELQPVVDLASARAVIDTIVEEGEGASGDGEDGHYGRFRAVERELAALTAEHGDFTPARPVLANPFVRQPPDADTAAVLSEPFTIAVAELGNGAYAAMLQVLARWFAHTNETDEELATLASVAVTAMIRLLRPLGTLLTRLPAGPDHPGMTAGMSFELYRSLHLLPHRRAAWALLHERLRDLGTQASRLAPHAPDADAAGVLDDVAGAFADLADELAVRVRTQPAYSSGPRS